MKQIILILTIIIVSTTSCKAQEVVNIHSEHLFHSGKYFKDLDNILGPFLGTCEWQNGSEIFKVTLWKEEMVECKMHQK